MLAKLQRFLSKQASSTKIAALHWKLDSFNIISLEKVADAYVVSYHNTHSFGLEHWQTGLSALLNKMPVVEKAVLVLSPEYYQLVQLDKPSVPEDELVSALRWQLKELVTIAVDDMQIGYFDLPTPHQQQQARIQVVVSSKQLLQKIVHILHKKHIAIDTIVPEEWVLVELVPEQNQPLLILAHQPGKDASITIVKKGQVSFSRRIRGLQQLHQFSAEQLQQGILDNLGLEVQRSVDYYEGQLKQAPVKHLMLALDTDAQSHIAEFFRQLGFDQVDVLDLSLLLPGLTNKERADFSLPLAAALAIRPGQVQEAQLENAR